MKTMKAIASLIVAVIFTANALAIEFYAGPDIYARAYEQVDHGTYEVTGDGLSQGFSMNIVYDGVYSKEDLMSPLRTSYALKFFNYKENVREEVRICDVDGNVLFTSDTWWKPEESLSSDGKHLSYSIPSWAGSIYLALADQVLEFDGEWASVNTGYGYTINLNVEDGYVTVPGWIYGQNGTFQYSENGKIFVFDIQTGLPVLGGENTIQNRAESIEGLETVYSDGMKITIPNVYLSPYSESIVYEHTLVGNGTLLVKAYGQWGETVKGVYYTVVGAGLEPVYIKAVNGVCNIPNMIKGGTIHLKFYWDKNSAKG